MLEEIEKYAEPISIFVAVLIFLLQQAFVRRKESRAEAWRLLKDIMDDFSNFKKEIIDAIAKENFAIRDQDELDRRIAENPAIIAPLDYDASRQPSPAAKYNAKYQLTQKLQGEIIRITQRAYYHVKCDIQPNVAALSKQYSFPTMDKSFERFVSSYVYLMGFLRESVSIYRGVDSLLPGNYYKGVLLNVVGLPLPLSDRRENEKYDGYIAPRVVKLFDHRKQILKHVPGTLASHENAPIAAVPIGADDDKSDFVRQLIEEDVGVSYANKEKLRPSIFKMFDDLINSVLEASNQKPA